MQHAHTPGPWRIDVDNSDDNLSIVGPMPGAGRYGIKDEWTIASVGDEVFWDDEKHRLRDRRRQVLERYADTNDGRFLQGGPEATELWRPMGLLEWHGRQYGTNFYSITDAGRAALTETP